MFPVANALSSHVARNAARPSSRSLSSQGNAALIKLKNALESYRSKHYTQELPSRFKKDIIRAAKVDQGSNQIPLQGMQRVLINIGGQNQITTVEMETIFRELGGTSRSIPADRLIKII